MASYVREQHAPYSVQNDNNTNMNHHFEGAFEQKVDRCRKKSLPDIINNASKAHAVYLIQSLLETAVANKESIKIVTGQLTPDFYAKLKHSFEQCLLAGLEVEVIVLDSDIDSSHPLSTLFNAQANGRIRSVPIAHRASTSTAPHFVLVGDRRYRLETDHAQAKAIASFNDPETGRWLADIYAYLDGLFTKRATPQQNAA